MSGIPAGAGSLLNKRLGKFEILALLALGGTAEIYLARIGGAAGFEKYVVVKCLHDHLNDDQDFVKMFLDEARLAAHLDHSNIVQTMELGEHDGRYYMVMEFLAGLSLAMIIRRVTERLPGGVLPVPLSLNMLAQSCAGLHYAHERAVSGKSLGIVHRDISPQNLVVSFEGVVKVVDFGIAKAEQRETKTRSGTIKGKFAYMSPEQCVANNVDRRTDVFALGIIAHEMLTGRRLFKRSSPYETYQAVIDCNVPKPSSQNVELDPALDELVMKALAKDKEKRYPNAEAFGDTILGYLHNRGKGSGPGDVARFFDQHFNQEIEEHGARMRELIEGRDISLSSGVTWGADDDKKGVETVDLKGNETQDLSVADLERPSSGSLSDVLSNMGQTGDASVDEAWGDDSGDDDESGPVEHTRIEANPLERLAEMQPPAPAPAAKKTPTPQPKPQPQPQPKPAPAPVAKTPIPSIAKKNPTPLPQPQDPAMRPPQQAKMPPSGPLPLPPTPPPGSAAPLGAPKGGKFPELANLPTMIADLDESSVSGVSNPQQDPQLANAKTALATPIKPDDPRAGVPRAAAVDHTQDAGQPFLDQMQPPARPSQPTAPPQQRTLFDPGGAGPAPQQPHGSGPHGSGPQPQPYNFDPNTGRPQQPYNNGYPPQQQPNGYPNQNGQYPPPQQQQQPYTHPNQTGPMPYPQQLDSGGYMQPNPGLMSPVGPQYPQAGVDWEAAAKEPLRKLPTWLLVTLFVVAIGIALGLTIVIARLARG